MTAPTAHLLTTATGGAFIVIVVLGALLVIIQTALKEHDSDSDQP